MSGRSKFGVGGANLVWVEQIWSGWSKFGVGGVDVGRTVWRVADNLEKTLSRLLLGSDIMARAI